MRKLVLPFLFLIQTSLFSAPYRACWDLDMSPYAGGEDLLLAERSLERAEIFLLSRTPLPYSSAFYARLWRLTELVAIWLPANYLAMLVQHEVFGHGYRVRDIGRGRARLEGYLFEVPPPYGNGGGATGYWIGENLTTTEESAVSSAGVESTAILAQLTKLKWLWSGAVDPRQAALYLLSQHDLNLYISTLKILNDDELDGHDIYGYLKALNYTYPEHILSKGRLRSLSWINLADPFTFYVIYSWFYFIASGKESPIPMIASRYLPGLRLGLTPFGPEVFFENYILYNESPLYFYCKGGHHANNSYYGIGMYAPSLYHCGPWTLGARLDLWRQPRLLLTPASTPIFEIDFDQPPNPQNPLYPPSEQHAVRYGISGSAIAQYRWFEAELGYKTRGFLPGYSLRAFPTVRLALVLNF